MHIKITAQKDEVGNIEVLAKSIKEFVQHEQEHDDDCLCKAGESKAKPLDKQPKKFDYKMLNQTKARSVPDVERIRRVMVKKIDKVLKGVK